MTREEYERQREAAAEAHASEKYDQYVTGTIINRYWSAERFAFLHGHDHCEQNPPPHVVALVEAAKKLRAAQVDYMMIRGSEANRRSVHVAAVALDEALAAFEAARNKGARGE